MFNKSIAIKLKTVIVARVRSEIYVPSPVGEGVALAVTDEVFILALLKGNLFVK